MAGPWEQFQQPRGPWEQFQQPRGPWDNFAPTGATPAPPNRVQSIADAVVNGFQSNALGLAVRGKLPEQQMGEDAPWYLRLASGMSNVVSDIPLSVAGALVGAPVGAAVSGPAAPLGAMIGGGAGAFGVPMALREALIEAYSNNHAASWQGVWEIAKAALKGGGKGAVIGGLTGGAGALVGRTVGAAIAPSIGTALTVKAAERTIGAAAVGTELATMTTASAAIEGRMPTAQDFMDGAILLGGMKAATHVAKGLRRIYVETGKTPAEVASDAARDPSIARDLIDGARPTLRSVSAETQPGLNGIREPISAELTSAKGADFVMKRQFRGHYELLAPDGEVIGGVSIRPTLANDWTANVVVEPKFQRQGIASAAYDFIEQVVIGKPLERAGGQSAEGRAFRDARQATLLHDGTAAASGIPAAYGPAALAERVKAATDRLIAQDGRTEALRTLLSGEIANGEVGKNAPQIGWEYVTDRDTLKGVLRVVSEASKAEIEKQRRGVVTNQASLAEARALLQAGSPEPHKVGAGANAGEAFVQAAVVRDALNNVHNVLAKYAGLPDSKMSAEAKLEQLAAIENLAMVNAEFAGIRAESGRTQQAFRAIKQGFGDLAGEADAIVAAAARKGPMQDLNAVVMKLKDDPTMLAKFLGDYNKAGPGAKVIEAWRAAIFSGPLTWQANVMGNTAKFAIDIPEKAVSATLFAAGKLAKGDPLSMAQYKARLFAPLYGAKFAALDGLRYFEETRALLAEHGLAKGAKQAGSNLADVLSKSDAKSEVYSRANTGAVGKAVGFSFGVLKAQDLPFRNIGERMAAYVEAVDRAVREGIHPDTREFNEAVVRYTNAPDFGLPAKMAAEVMQRIEQAGAEQVFGQRLGPRLERVSSAIHGTAWEFLLPARRTPANLLDWSVQHIPGLNFVSSRWQADWAAGGERAANAAARVVVGTALAATAITLVNNGMLTGGGLMDKELSGTKGAAGVQPYSIEIDGKYYSIQRIEPAAKVFMLVGDLAEIIKSPKTSWEDRAKASAMMVLAFGNAMISTTYLSGLANTMKALLDPARYGGAWLEGYAASVVPKLLSQPVVMADEYKREVDDVLEAIQSQLPYFREKLLPKRDVWGEPVKNERWFSVLPVATSVESQDKVRQEALRLAVGIMPAPDYVTEKGPLRPGERQIKMDAAQKDIMREVSGKNAMTILAPMVNSGDWEKIPDFAKAAIYRKILADGRRVGQYKALPPDDAARMQVIEKQANEILRQVQEAQGVAAPQPAPERRVR